ncbi:hypothetical protein T484DRAFT_3239360 [Baffinella frigidus]|nr:hypothetical protein T484DRAFT_3239360 [Cryptophyta sp. CCMP2293]
MNFSYKEERERKNALVKLRVCPDCAIKLNYRKLKRDEEERKKDAKEAKKDRKRQRKEDKRIRKGGGKRARLGDAGGSESDGSSDGAEGGGGGEWMGVESKSTGKVYWYEPSLASENVFIIP